jgi:hypothetical protein
MEAEVSLPHPQEPATCSYLEYKRISRSSKPCEMFRNIVPFYSKELLTSRLTPKLEDHSLLAVRDCSFNIFAATIRTPKLEDHSLLAVRDCSFNIFAATLHIWRPFWFITLRSRSAVAPETHGIFNRLELFAFERSIFSFCHIYVSRIWWGSRHE